jgi:hypothetical protein
MMGTHESKVAWCYICQPKNTIATEPDSHSAGKIEVENLVAIQLETYLRCLIGFSFTCLSILSEFYPLLAKAPLLALVHPLGTQSPQTQGSPELV